MDNEQKEPQSFTRRNFLKLLLGGAAALIGGTSFVKTDMFYALKNDARQMLSKSDAYNLRQLITADPSRSRVIMWQTDAKQTKSGVEYRISDGEIKTAPAVEVGFTDAREEILQYKADLVDLVGGQTYEYRLREGDKVGEWHELKTPKADEEFTCLIFPDSQSADYTDWANLFQAATSREPKAAFFVNMGDLVDNGEDKSQWQAWLGSVAVASDKMPVVPVMGNHETYTLTWGVRLPHAYLRYLPSPANDSDDFDGYYYSFDYGDAHFIVLNTQWEEFDGKRPGLLAEQKAWLKNDAAVSRKKWKIVLLHKDVLQYRINGRPQRPEGISEVGREFMPLFDELGIDLVFTAHLHTYRNRGKIRNFQADDAGPCYILTGVAGDVRYPGLWIDHALDKKIAPQPETDNYLTLTVTKDALIVKCFLPDGKEIDEVRLSKFANKQE